MSQTKSPARTESHGAYSQKGGQKSRDKDLCPSAGGSSSNTLLKLEKNLEATQATVPKGSQLLDGFHQDDLGQRFWFGRCRAGLRTLSSVVPHVQLDTIHSIQLPSQSKLHQHLPNLTRSASSLHWNVLCSHSRNTSLNLNKTPWAALSNRTFCNDGNTIATSHVCFLSTWNGVSLLYKRGKPSSWTPALGATLILAQGSLTFWQALVSVASSKLTVNYNSSVFSWCLPPSYSFFNLNKGHCIDPYPFSLTKHCRFPTCADTSRNAGNLFPRCSLRNQFVCPDLSEEPGGMPISMRTSAPWNCLHSLKARAQRQWCNRIWQLLLAGPRFTQSSVDSPANLILKGML